MKIDNSELLKIVPYSIAKDEAVQRVAKSLDTNLNDVTVKIRNVLIYSRIDELDDALLDSLAWQFHVDVYDAAYSLDQKRLLVKEAIKDHFYKGTPYALKAALSVIGDARLEEWFDYDAKPYHFRVYMQRMPQSSDEYGKIDNICKATKNVRSWCDGIRCDIGVDWKLYVAGAKQTKKSITIYPMGTAEELAGATLYTGIAAKYGEEISLLKKEA